MSNRTGVIYKLTIGKYSIVGSTINLRRRKIAYNHTLSNNKHKNNLLQGAFNNHNTLLFEILQDNIPEDILQYIESIWIGSTCSRIEDKKQGANMRDGHRPNFSKEVIERVRNSNKGRKISSEAKDKISKGLMGRCCSTKTRNKIGLKNSTPVSQYTLDGELVKQWCSISEAARQLNLHDSNIVKCLKGIRTKSGEFRWKYT